MRVTINRSQENDGIVFKKIRHYVRLQVEFSEEEKHVITSTGLAKTPFHFVYREGEEPREVPVSWLLPNKKGEIPAPIVAVCAEERTANIAEEKLREALQELKQKIEYHSKPHKASDTFEL